METVFDASMPEERRVQEREQASHVIPANAGSTGNLFVDPGSSPG